MEKSKAGEVAYLQFPLEYKIFKMPSYSHKK